MACGVETRFISQRTRCHVAFSSSMVCCFPEGGSTYSDSVDVPVSADILWSVVRDLDALPQVVGAVVEYTPEDKTKELAVGFRFEEQRMAKQKTYTLKKTVTRFETDNLEERCLSFGITPTTNTDVVNTSTLIVQPVKEGNTSRLFTRNGGRIDPRRAAGKREKIHR